jgi:FkbM family methyltransferase
MRIGGNVMKKIDRVSESIFNAAGQLVLADVGASGESWDSYKAFENVADLLRFDPDIRAMEVMEGKNGRRIVTISAALVEDERPEVEFYLTRSPYCSSTLEPAYEKLARYPYRDLFIVDKKVSVPAISVVKALSESGFPQIDWIKLDTQGTEGRILRSVPEASFDRLLVCDVEASLYAHYKGADTIEAIHPLMIENDFWVAQMTPHHNLRIPPARAEEFNERYQGQQAKYYNVTRTKEPTSLEFIYVRTVEGALKRDYDTAALTRLFLCCYALEKFEYCLEVAQAIENAHGDASLAMAMREDAYAALDDRVKKNALDHYIGAVSGRVRCLASKFGRVQS